MKLRFDMSIVWCECWVGPSKSPHQNQYSSHIIRHFGCVEDIHLWGIMVHKLSKLSITINININRLCLSWGRLLTIPSMLQVPGTPVWCYSQWWILFFWRGFARNRGWVSWWRGAAECWVLWRWWWGWDWGSICFRGCFCCWIWGFWVCGCPQWWIS